MNFVVVSWNFLPQNDPEAFCTARFVNGLAAQGHNVTVITEKHKDDVPKYVVNQILRASIRVEYFPYQPVKNRYLKRVFRSVELETWATITLQSCIRTVNEILSRTENPILISRASPIRSSLIARKCCKKAIAWIAHFSDPYPWDDGCRIKDRVITLLKKRAVRKIISKASAVSVTCKQVIPFFEREYSSTFRHCADKFFVVPHIGDPLLEPKEDCSFSRGDKVPIISHCGMLFARRYSVEVMRELHRLADSGSSFRFLQYGRFDISAKRAVEKAGYMIESVECNDPAETTCLYNQSSVCLVIDTKTEYSHSLFLPSKFVYLLFTQTPLVVYTTIGSAMHEVAIKYPNAGIVWADVSTKGDLAQKISMILNSGQEVDRSQVRKLYSSEFVIKDFTRIVESILK